MTDNHWEMARPTYIENWAHALYPMSIPQVRARLSVEQAKALGRVNGEWGAVFAEYYPGDPHEDREMMEGLLGKLQLGIASNPGGSFVRLGSRSPKDSWLGHREGFRCETAERALALLTDSSERVHDDLSMAVHHDYGPSIYFRQWLDIPKWTEFRGFMRGRELVGISQYFYGEHLKKVAKNEQAIRRVIANKFFPRFREACHLDDAVFDVLIRCHDLSFPADTRLIEINPFFDLTDPCLFSWKDGGDFDGGFRFVREEPRKCP